jgi:hypothetical protein
MARLRKVPPSFTFREARLLAQPSLAYGEMQITRP